MAEQEGSRSARPRGPDSIDLSILHILRDEGRIPVADLAERVHISRANGYSRLERLQKLKVLEGFSARIDSRQLGLKLAAIVRLNCEHKHWRGIIDALGKVEAIEYAGLMTGETDVLALVKVVDMDDLTRLLLEELQSIEGVISSQTDLVLREVVRRAAVLPKKPK